MCTGFEIAALGALAGGTALQVSSANQAERAQKRALLRGIEQESAIQDKANDRTKDYVEDTFDPTARNANYEAQATKQEQSFGELLAKQAAQGEGAITPATAGAVSDSYTRSKADATAKAAERSRQLSKLLARGGASGNLRGEEALTGADYSSDMMGYGVESRLNKNRTGSNFDVAGGAGNDLALLGGLLSGSAGLIAGGGKKKVGTGLPAYGTDYGE